MAAIKDEAKIIAKYQKIVSDAMIELMFNFEIIGYTALNIGGVEVVGDIYPAIGWTNYKAIYINAPYCARYNLGLEHIKFLIAHEVFHLILMSKTRGKGKIHDIWNMASDFAINQILIEDEEVIKGKTVGEFIDFGYYDKKYKNMSAEEIYQSIMKDIENESKKNPSNKGNKNQEKGISISLDNIDDQKDQEQNQDKGKGQDQNKDQDQKDQDKKDQDQNKSKDKDQDKKDQNNPYNGTFGKEEQRDKEGKVNLDVHLDTEDPKIQEDMREAAIRVQQILEANAAQGKLSNGMKRFIDQLPKVKENWRYLLDRYLKSFKKAESSWKRPNKRFFCGGDPVKGGFYLPTRYDTPELNVAIGIDTSGSISDQILTQFFGHIYKILQSYKHFTVQIFCWSTVVHEETYRELNEKNIASFNPCDKDWIMSYGGTIPQPAFDYVAKLKKKPDVFINFTDGKFWDDIKTTGNFPTIFAIYGNDNFKIPSGCKKATKMKIED